MYKALFSVVWGRYTGEVASLKVTFWTMFFSESDTPEGLFVQCACRLFDLPDLVSLAQGQSCFLEEQHLHRSFLDKDLTLIVHDLIFCCQFYKSIQSLSSNWLQWFQGSENISKIVKIFHYLKSLTDPKPFLLLLLLTVVFIRLDSQILQLDGRFVSTDIISP